MLDVKRLNGMLNNDDAESDILQPQHIHAKNIRFYGGPNGLIAENVKGNFKINNSTLPAGTNECIGTFYDQVHGRIIWFNYNSTGKHGIYSINVQTDIITTIFVCLTNSATDILTFNLNYPVHSSAIVYRTAGDGDLLYWTDGYNRPRYLNLDTVAALQPFTEAMINVAKNAPLRPPTVIGYLSDATINYNAVKNKLFRFSYRWVFKNGEKSTPSPISTVPLPAVIDPNVQVDSTINNYISFTVYSPNLADYQKIEILGQESLGNTWGDFFLIDSLDKTDYSIPVNSSFTYKFYNNSSYIFIDPNETDLYFDYSPDKANTLELLNGNVLIYGGITDGYANLLRTDVDVTITAQIVTASTNGIPAFKWGQDQRFGLVYFDDRGKTNGVVSFVTDSAVDTTDFSVSTPAYPSGDSYTSKIPQIDATINHTPPTWATSYQWVRADLTPKFLHWVTVDYYDDGEFLYLGIESLVQANAKNGFLPSYEFVVGDRVKILASIVPNAGATAFSIQQDLSVLGVVQKVMHTPAVLGAFIKVQRPTSFPTPAYTFHMLIEIYTPKPKIANNKNLFYEWGQKYDIYTLSGNRYHRGQTRDQTASLSATFSWTDGDVYIKRRRFYIGVPIEIILSSVYYLYMMDSNWNDFVETSSNANGRAWVIDENAKQEYNGVLQRWGGEYQSGTNINALNRFRPNDFAEADRSKGDIRRYKVRDRIIRVFQDRAVGQYGVYARFIQNNSGVPELVTTNEIITANNIQYYQGTYGLCGYPTNLTSTQRSDYFTDVVTGRAIRLSQDGITDLGLLYKGQYTFTKLVIPYNKTQLRPNESKAKVMGFFDFFDNEFHTLLQETVSLDAKNYSFNESRNSFCCDEYDYHPEAAVGAEDVFYTWKNGDIWKHDNEASRCEFYGVRYNAELTIVFNPNILEKKSWHIINQIASDTWAVPLIYTNVMSYGTQRQETNLVTAEFEKLEANPTSSIKRDIHSQGGKVEGGFMKGNWMAAKFKKENAQYLINLVEVSVAYIDSPLTSK